MKVDTNNSITNNMEKITIINYLNAFRKAITPFIRDGIGIKSTTFPFDKGASVLFELGENIKAVDDIRSESDSFPEALRRTNLFTVDGNETAPEELLIAPIGNHILLIKRDDKNLWEIDMASKDVNTLIEKVRGDERKD